MHRFLVRNTIEERIHGLLQGVGETEVDVSNSDETAFTVGAFKLNNILLFFHLLLFLPERFCCQDHIRRYLSRLTQNKTMTT